jgi:hypothetical protein
MQQLENKLKYLRMSAVLQSLKQHNEAAQEQQLSYLEFFEMLIEDECVKRKANVLRQRLAKSKLNTQKSFEHYDLNFQPELDKKLLAEIRACRFVEERKTLSSSENPAPEKHIWLMPSDWRLPVKDIPLSSHTSTPCSKNLHKAGPITHIGVSSNKFLLQTS